ncbi:MAG TPA: serine hydrolase domain-containing protein [Candidatus Wallbacteria bacterium]|nr:serine hydrolase domain-containing protein [Candidatus Wallbacteria bacterium]
MKKVRGIVLLCFFVIALAASVCEAKNSAAAYDEKYKNAITAARETMWKAITGGQGSGASVAVMDNGKIVYSEGIGVADRAKNSPVNKYTRFNIGSTSKMFVAAAVMILADEGKVMLDCPVVKYIPEFTMKDPRYKDITVRMLFNHSSGLPGTSTATGYEADAETHKVLLEAMSRAFLKHRPGAMSIYCNDGFTLAEIIVEKVSGMKFMDFVQKRIFKPLGMKNSGASTGEILPENAAFYYDPATGKKHPHEALSVYGAGGLSSTAEDLCRFGYSFCEGGPALLSKAALSEMRKTQPTSFSDKLRGPQMMEQFGWEYVNLATYAAQNVQVMAKGGNTTYNSSDMQIVPEKGIAVSIIISGKASGEALARPILDGVMKDKNIARPKVKDVKKPVEAQTVPDELASYEGVYTSDSKIASLKFDEDKKGFGIYEAQRGCGANDKMPETPIYAFRYNAGFFYNHEKNLKCYLTDVDGVKYIVLSDIDNYEVDSLAFQKLEPVKNPVSMKIDMNGKTWLIRNARPFIVYGSIMPVVSDSIKGLAGYIDFCGAKKVESPDFASIAATSFRDQAELYLVEKEGGIWALSGPNLFSRDGCAKKIEPGVNRVFIGIDNYNEWLKVEKGAILGFEKPDKGRIMILKGESTLFDSVVDDNKEIYAPEGSYIFFAGSAGDVFKATVR